MRHPPRNSGPPRRDMSDESGQNSKPLQEALNLTRRMWDAARAGEWESLVVMEKTRQILFRKQFDGQPPGHVAAEDRLIRPLILEILEIDREVLALGAQLRDEAATVLSQISSGKVAIRAYRRFKQS